MDVVKAKQNKNYKFEIIIGILTIIIAQIIFKIIKANQISIEILITVMMLGGIIFAVSIAKQKEKMGTKMSIIAIVLVLAMCVTSALNMGLIYFYPNQIDEHKIMSLIIIISSFISFFTVVIFSIVGYSIIIKRKK